MKNLFIGLGVIAMFGFTSCKKYYTCECTSTANGVSSTASSTSEEKMSKSDAKEECEAGNSSASAGGSTASVSCELK